MGSSKRSSLDGGSGRSISICQDCGNKAKRDCEHKRCRTCCKTRGFHCPTHVRSTWIPVARRRQLLHHRLSAATAAATAAAAASTLPLRLLTSLSSSSSGFQGRAHSFPAEVKSAANFRCVRVIFEDNVVDQAAYQASVTIRGHVFSGILYDQGPHSTSPGGEGGVDGESSSSDQLYLHNQVAGMSTAAAHPGGRGGGVGGTSGGPNLAYLSYPYHHQHPFYTSSNAPVFLPGMQFFPHPKP